MHKPSRTKTVENKTSFWKWEWRQLSDHWQSRPKKAEALAGSGESPEASRSMLQSHLGLRDAKYLCGTCGEDGKRDWNSLKVFTRSSWAFKILLYTTHSMRNWLRKWIGFSSLQEVNERENTAYRNRKNWHAKRQTNLPPTCFFPSGSSQKPGTQGNSPRHYDFNIDSLQQASGIWKMLLIPKIKKPTRKRKRDNAGSRKEVREKPYH